MSAQAPGEVIWFINTPLWEVGENGANRPHGEAGSAALVTAGEFEAQFKPDKLSICCADLALLAVLNDHYLSLSICATLQIVR